LRAGKELRDLLRFVFFLIAFLVVSESQAHAYVDPGAGSMVVQIVLAVVVGALFQVRRILNFFRSDR